MSHAIDMLGGPRGCPTDAVCRLSLQAPSHATLGCERFKRIGMHTVHNQYVTSHRDPETKWTRTSECEIHIRSIDSRRSPVARDYDI